MKIMLIFPPQFDATTPNLSLPCLAASLREAGHEVVLKDVNIESFDVLLSREELERAYEYICTRRKNFMFSGTDPREVDRLVKNREFLMDEVEKAKSALKDPSVFYDYTRYIKSLNILKDCLQFISLAYYRTALSFTFYTTAHSCYSTQQILKAVRDEYSNLYIDFYRRYTIPYIISENPKVIGISISVDDQLIPALTIAYMVKNVLKDVHIVVGGSYFTNLKDNLENNHKLFTLFDSVILYEGETALTELVNCLQKGVSLDNVPNLIYKDGSQIIVNDKLHIENIDELPTPDFDGLPLNLYLSPKLILPIYTSRGCYWGRCAFCSFCANIGSKYRVRGAKKVRQDMEKLRQKYGCNTFTFADEAISPATMNSLSDEIIENKLDVNWFSFARFEKQLDSELCNKIVKGGCRLLIFGLESVSQRVLDFMDKGVDLGTMKQVLSATTNAGITNYISFFFGFPTETFEEAKQTMKFIIDNIESIGWIRFGYFDLVKYSKVQLKPQNYKIKEIFQKEGFDIALMYDYIVEEGLTSNEAKELSGLFLQVAQEYYRYLLNFHMMLYIMHYKTNELVWPTASREERLLGRQALQEQRIENIKKKFNDLFSS